MFMNILANELTKQAYAEKGVRFVSLTKINNFLNADACTIIKPPTHQLCIWKRSSVSTDGAGKENVSQVLHELVQKSFFTPPPPSRNPVFDHLPFLPGKKH